MGERAWHTAVGVTDTNVPWEVFIMNLMSCGDSWVLLGAVLLSTHCAEQDIQTVYKPSVLEVSVCLFVSPVSSRHLRASNPSIKMTGCCLTQKLLTN